MKRWSTPLVRWYVLLLAVLLALTPTASRLVSVWHPALIVVCHADGGTASVPDPADTTHALQHAGDACPLCHIGWVPPPPLHSVALPTYATERSNQWAPDTATPPPYWTPQSPRAPPAWV